MIKQDDVYCVYTGPRLEWSIMYKIKIVFFHLEKGGGIEIKNIQERDKWTVPTFHYFPNSQDTVD